MHYLGLAMFAEGPTDHRFLRPLLYRLCDELCLGSRTPVEVSEVLELHTPASLKDRPRAERIAVAAESASDAWRVLFVHADADGNDAAARAERVEPALKAVRERLGSGRHGVAVVPVRSTDAWALADADALRRVFGTTLTPLELGVPPLPRDVERLADPKSTFLHSFEATRPPRSRARSGVAPYLDRLGDEICIQALRQLDAFRRLESDLTAALRDLQILTP